MRVLSARQRAWLLATLALMTVLAVVADYYAPADWKLRPLSFILVIALTGVAGLRVGIIAALLMAVAFTEAERRGGFGLPTSADLFTMAILFFTLSAAVILVRIIRTSAARASATAVQLKDAQRENVRLKDFADTQEALAETHARYVGIGESIPFGTWQTDAAGKTTFISESFKKLIGIETIDEFRGLGWLSRLSPDDAKRLEASWKKRDTAEGIWEEEFRVRAVDNQVYTILARGVRIAGPDGASRGWVGMNLDISERKRAEEQLTFLADLSATLSTSLDSAATLERVADLIVPRYADWCTIDVLQDDGSVETMVIRHNNPAHLDLARRFGEEFPLDPNSPQGPNEVIRTGQPQLYGEITDEELGVLPDPRAREMLRSLNMTSVMIVPLLARGRTLGALTFIAAESRKRYGSEDLKFALLIARRVALAYDNALLYERQHRVADTLQRVSLPATLPLIPGVAINAYYIPGMTEAEIGGDWYDAFQFPDGRVGLSIGDVAGKGLEAAAAMGSVRQAVRGAAFEDATPSRVLERVNRLLLHDKPEMVTAVYAVFDPIDSSLTWAVAGHPPPMLADAEGGVRPLALSSPPLGVFHEARFPEQRVVLSPGALLVFYTDGLIEQDRDVLAGEKQLREAIALELGTDSRNPAQAICSRIVGTTARDDIAILTLALAAKPLTELDLVLEALPINSRTLREALRRLYVAAGLDEDRAYSLQVASGEAIMNVIEHAYGVRQGNVHVRGFVRDGSVVVEVEDSGHWRRQREDARGRGLMLMRALVDKVELNNSDKGTMVRLTHAIAGPAA